MKYICYIVIIFYSNKPIFIHLCKQTMKLHSAYNPKTDVAEDLDLLTETSPNFTLIVWNDEVNTFEWVIETLIEVCNHTEEQAEQCAMLIHTKGKYAVKNGSYDNLKPQCDAITERKIGATIEVLA